MLPEERSFWVRGDDGQEYGPVGLEELREWVKENRAGLGTEVRLDEPHTRWQAWQSYPELVALLAEARVTSPVPGIPGLVIAQVWRRVLALGTDMILTIFLVMPIFLALLLAFRPDWWVQLGLSAGNPHLYPQPQLAENDQRIGSLILDSFLVLYMACFHAAHGQTPAKTILGIRVVNQYGQKPGFVQTLLRGLMLVVSINLLGIPFLYAFFNPERRTFHDYVAGTYVVEA